MNAGFQLKAVMWVRKKDLGLSCFHARIGSSDPAKDLEISECLFTWFLIKRFKNKAMSFTYIVWWHQFVKYTTASAILLHYRASAEETFKGHSVGRSARDMHRLLWGKHDYRVKNPTGSSCTWWYMYETWICSFITNEDALECLLYNKWKISRTFSFPNVKAF